MQVATATCEEKKGKFVPRSGGQLTSNCVNPSTAPMPSKAQSEWAAFEFKKHRSIKLASFSCLSSPRCQTFKLVISDCAVTKGEQVPCGQSGISSSDCEKMGCCVDSSTYSCYYPLDGKASVYGDDIKIYFNLCSNRRPLYFLQLYWFNFFLPFSFQSALEISTLFLPFAPTLQPSLWTPPKLLFLAIQTVNQSLLMTRLPSSNSKLQNVELVLM